MALVVFAGSSCVLLRLRTSASLAPVQRHLAQLAELLLLRRAFEISAPARSETTYQLGA